MHVLARLQGFGVIVLPKAPYRIERIEGEPDTRLRIFHGEQSGVVDVREVVRGEERTELADISEGDPRQSWRIETGVVTHDWPHGFALSSDPDELSPYVLFGPDDAMIWIAGPVDRARTTPIEKLVAEEQTVRAVAQAGDNERLDVDYVIDDEPWWQRRYVLAWGEGRALVLTAQARAATEETAAEAVDAIERSIAPYYTA